MYNWSNELNQARTHITTLYAAQGPAFLQEVLDRMQPKSGFHAHLIVQALMTWINAMVMETLKSPHMELKTQVLGSQGVQTVSVTVDVRVKALQSLFSDGEYFFYLAKPNLSKLRWLNTMLGISDYFNSDASDELRQH